LNDVTTPSEHERLAQSLLKASRNPAAQWLALLAKPRLLFALPYVALLAWFKWVDVYHRHFSQSGFIVIIYNALRVLFIFYLFWMVTTAGLALLRIFARQELAQISIFERLALGFFAGTGVWHLLMLALGYANLYTAPTAVILTLPMVLLAYDPAQDAARDIYRTLTSSSLGRLNWALLALVAVTASELLLVKGLYPGGGHDYFTHYFYYLETATERHGLWPNEVWYHYYYSKGAGLFFLGILLTDPLAPQLVTFCFMMVASVALMLLLRRIAPDTPWPLVGGVLLLAIYVCTPGTAFLYAANGGWGEFEKLHEINAALVIAIVWMSFEALEGSGRMRLLWATGTVSAIACAIIVNITIAVFLGGVFFLLATAYAVLRRFERALASLGFCAAAILTFGALLGLNQITTGLANDQGLWVFWRFANFEKLASWGALPLLIQYYFDLKSLIAASMPLSIQVVNYFIETFRLDLLSPLIIGGMIVSLTAIARGRFNRSLETPALILAASTITFVAILLFFGRAQQISFYRYSSFATALAIACGTLAWNLPSKDDPFLRIVRLPVVPLAVLLLCTFTLTYPQYTLKALDRGFHFDLGLYSIDEAYSNQYGPSPRAEWSAIYSGARGAYAVVGPRTPIWSLHIHTYCMLPDCLVESYPSFLMTRHWDRVMFGTPDEARQLLHAAQLDYFLFTRDDEIRDPLPRSALFSPDSISQYLGVRWTDGTTTLLTWLGPGIQPLDSTWIADYRRAVEASGTVASFPYSAMKEIFAQLSATPHPWTFIPLPQQAN
jgi:hypothetical protein